ncbi:type II toxin-antitoxin system RelE/ParE family toxin [Methylocella sp.]|uniref:type II toxin-antitoxin system RelE/ParE family toxin n=1 Tax=Methylocella sp. TaxID=1978226 RepID=UPI0037839A4A
MARALHTIIETEAFISKASKIMSDEERAAIVDIIAADPMAGVLVKGTGGLRKLRVPLEGRGKRGGGRVIYWFHSARFPAALLWVFAKNEAADLTKEQEATLAKVAASLMRDLGGGHEG